MKANRFRLAAVAALLLVTLFGGQMVKAATTFPGSITITSPTAKSFKGGAVTVKWTWKTGTNVKSTSTVDAAFTPDGLFWYPIAAGVPIRFGAVQWTTKTDTAALPDGAYALRLTVHGTSIKSSLGPINIDNTPPEVKVTQPSSVDAVVDDQTLASVRYIIGMRTLQAEARDSGAGVAGVHFSLTSGENVIDLGDGVRDADKPAVFSLQFDFSSVTPGQYSLVAEATDNVGNTNSDIVDVIVVPGPGVANGEPPTVPDPTQDLPPVPDPTACLSDPTSCVPTTVPNPLQSLPPAPDPGVTPPAVPDPTSCSTNPTSCVPPAPAP